MQAAREELRGQVQGALGAFWTPPRLTTLSTTLITSYFTLTVCSGRASGGMCAHSALPKGGHCQEVLVQGDSLQGAITKGVSVQGVQGPMIRGSLCRGSSCRGSSATSQSQPQALSHKCKLPVTSTSSQSQAQAHIHQLKLPVTGIRRQS